MNFTFVRKRHLFTFLFQITYSFDRFQCEVFKNNPKYVLNATENIFSRGSNFHLKPWFNFRPGLTFLCVCVRTKTRCLMKPNAHVLSAFVSPQRKVDQHNLRSEPKILNHQPVSFTQEICSSLPSYPLREKLTNIIRGQSQRFPSHQTVSFAQEICSSLSPSLSLSLSLSLSGIQVAHK